MIKELWNQIQNDQEVRQSLSKIRQEIKNDGERAKLSLLIEGDESILIGLLQSEDAKTRKNAALLMGDLGNQMFLAPVWKAYQEEQQRFVKSSYLAALGHFDYGEYLDAIKDRLTALKKEPMTEENQKHVMEEMRELSALVTRAEGSVIHSFTGWDEPADIFLLTNRNFRELTRDELLALEPNAKTKLLGAGVMASVTNLRWLRDIRTYQELLFVVREMGPCEMEPNKIAQTIVNSPLLAFMAERHEGKAPYYFRLEMKSKRDLGQKSVFLKKLSAEIESLSDRKLINTTDNYEFELRLIENKLGNCNIMIKLFTLKDTRFTYRKEVIPTSIKPVNAALTAALAKEYMKEDGQVLDPFCGVGTMLIERHKAVRANTSYGIDIQEAAIIKARKNAETAKQVIHFVNRDFFQFNHDYLFDEVITNMPFQIGQFTEADVLDIYNRFFKRIPSLLKDGAVLILYTHNQQAILRLTYRTRFSILKDYEISKREGTHVMILRYGAD
ncbi:TRM11 family SAM-dependent methyltransferase [Anaerolentibacter hominis]|uniref:TRM11 family SAM-dependent methyltransferase n=1 Tax=Anaerolentibacter hominis TaxID=3079009 RepID=UPI0031B8B1AE